MRERTSWPIVIAATLVMASSYLDRQVLAALAPAISNEFSFSAKDYALVQSAFSLAYLVGAPLAGHWLDRIGPRRGLLLATALWSLAALAHACVSGFWSLLAARVALGLAESPSFVGAAKAVQAVAGRGARPSAVGLLYSGSSIGAAAAQILAAHMLANANWRWAFVVSSATGALWIPLWIAVTYRSDVRAALDSSGDSAPALAPGLGATLQSPSVWRACLLVLAAAPCVAFILVWGPKLLVQHYGLSPADAARRLWPPPLCFDLGSIGFGALCGFRRRLRAQVVLWPLAVTAGILTSCVLWMPRAQDGWTAVGWAALSAAGCGGLFALLMTDLMDRVSPTQIGAAAGLTAAAQAFVSMLVNPLIGAAVDATTHGFGVAALAVGAVVVPTVLLWSMWTPRVLPVQAVVDGMG